MRPILERAGARIASMIMFKAQVNVKVVFEAGIYQGKGTPTYLRATRNNGDVLLYPQALVKQSQLVPNGHDIYLRLESSSNNRYKFKSDGVLDLESK